MSEPVIRIADVRRGGWCMKGVREWCTHNGIDHNRLLGEGIPISEVEHMDDAFVKRVVAKARERRRGS